MLTDCAVLKAWPAPYTVTVLPVVSRCAVRFALRCRRFQACMMPLLRRASQIIGNRCKGATVVVPAVVPAFGGSRGVKALFCHISF